jgi:branched-chain amino acid aminotransferase
MCYGYAHRSVHESEGMTIPISILDPAAGLKPAPYQARSLSAAARHEPEGVYTVSRTYHGDRAVLLDVHFDRLEASARALGIPLKLDRRALRQALAHIIRQAGFPESRFRITIPQDNPMQVILAVEPLSPPPPSLLERGVTAATLALERPHPQVKTNRWILQRQEAKSKLPPSTYEGILVNRQGELLEGLSSNFYAVLDGALRTAGEDQALQGVARHIVLRVAPQILPVELKPVRREHIPRLEEAFLSSSSRGVVPILSIDGEPVGDGRPGPHTKAIQRAYEAWVETHLEPIDPDASRA